MIKKLPYILVLTIVSVFFMPFFSDKACALEDPEVSGCTSAYLYNIENDKVLYELNADSIVYPVSSAKIMTGIIAVEQLGARLNETITVTEDMLKNVYGNNIKMSAGEKVTVKDMLYACISNCSNDAAHVLAVTAAGSVEAFVQMMNERAGQLGAKNTFYTNPTGIHDDNMKTTARDVALISKHALSLPLFAEAAASKSYEMPATNMSQERVLYSRNALVSKKYDPSYYLDKATGLNVGYTPQGGYCIAASAADGELTYIAVVMNASKNEDEEIMSYKNARELFTWAFKSYGYTEVLSQKSVMYEIPISLSSATDHVIAQPASELSAYLPSDIDKNDIVYQKTLNVEELTAPVKKGDVIGSVVVSYEDKILGSADLVCASDVDRSNFLYILSQIETFTGSRFFRGTLISIVVLSVLYVLGNAFYRARKNRLR